MNIESIIEKANLFTELAIESGFQRDITEHIKSLQHAHNQNLKFMKEISNDILLQIDSFESNSLDQELDVILKQTNSFLNDLKSKILTLNQNTEIDQTKYYQQFNKILNTLSKSLNENENEINEILSIFGRYSSKITEYEEADKAVVSLIFKDLHSTKTLKEFSNILSIWSKILRKYHTLLTSESPEEFELETIQSGSIDVIFNLNVDIAFSLTEVFKYGLDLFLSYLIYKEKTKDQVISIYDDDAELIELEEKKEKLLLDKIYIGIKNKILEQHEEKLINDTSIEKSSLENKIDDVAKRITEHIIRGNEYKILSKIEDKTDDEGHIEDSYEENKIQLREVTSKAKNSLKKLSAEDTQILLDKYEIRDE